MPELGLDLDSSVAYNFVLIDGAFNASCWNPFARILQAAGHTVIRPRLPTQDPYASFEDDTEAVRNAIKGRHNLVLMPHSRGIETARLLATEDIGKFVATQVVSSGGPHAYELDSKFPEAAQDRYTEAYRESIITGIDSMTRISGANAQKFLYHDVENTALALEAAYNLEEQRDSKLDNTPIFYIPSRELPVKVWLGTNDRALNILRARRVFEQWAGTTAEELPTGHTPQLAMVNQFARLVVDFANRARKNPGSLIVSSMV